MNSKFFKLILLVVFLAFANESIQAQRVVKKRTATTKKKTTNKNTSNKDATLVQTPPKDTTPPVVVPPPSLALDTVRKSLRQDNIVDRNPVKDITPLNYEYIREDDAIYQQR